MKLMKIDLNFIIVALLTGCILCLIIPTTEGALQNGLLDVLKLLTGGMIGYLSKD